MRQLIAVKSAVPTTFLSKLLPVFACPLEDLRSTSGLLPNSNIVRPGQNEPKQHRRRGLGSTLIAICLAAAALGAVWFWRAPLLREVAVLWVRSDNLERADAIVVLGGGHELRPFAAAELYKEGVAGRILIPQVRPSAVERLGISPPENEQIREILARLGIPHEAVTSYGKDVSSTFEEARSVRLWAEQAGVKSVIIPVELFGTRRVHWIFTRELRPVGVRVGVKVLSHPDYSVNDWWYHEAGLIAFQNEVIKYVYYRAKY